MGTEGITALMSSVVQLNELRNTLIEGGFTEAEALYLVGCVLTGGPVATPPEGDR